MTKKQGELIQSMVNVLSKSFNVGNIGKKKNYTTKEAIQLIKLNKDLFFEIIDEGQCTPIQYEELTRIAGRRPRKERREISFTQAVDWINEFKNRKVG